MMRKIGLVSAFALLGLATLSSGAEARDRGGAVAAGIVGGLAAGALAGAAANSYYGPAPAYDYYDEPPAYYRPRRRVRTYVYEEPSYDVWGGPAYYGGY